MKLGLAGRSVLVMAGSQGIGLASALGFHAEGAKVTICARSAGPLEEAAAQMPGCQALVADASQPEDIDRVVREASGHFGPVEVLVNNVGGPPPGLFDALSDADWEKAVNLTLMSAIRASRAVLPAMRERHWGRIVNISSSGVKQPVPGLTLSNSVRMAVLGWAKTLAAQVGPDNVLVNTVCPGWTRTARVDSLLASQSAETGKSPEDLASGIAREIPLGRIGDAEEVANLVVFLGSEAASYITGTAIQVDGGLTKGYA